MVMRTLGQRLLLAAVLCGASAPSAQAFCGFFVSGADASLTNNASQVVLLRKGNHTVMSLSNNYQGPPEDFAMVVPVPVVLKQEQVKTLAPDVFTRVDQLSAPRLVEYWEQDPCYTPPRYMESEKGGMANEDDGAAPAAQGLAQHYGVKIEAKFNVGEYQILVLSAKESNGLETFLRVSKYKLPSGAAAALAPYIRDQMKFFVAKVDIKKVKKDSHGAVVLSPLRFDFDAPELRLPVRLGLLNAPSGNSAAAKQDLIVYILHPEKRFEVANYKNVFIPTNLEVSNDVRKSFPAFYAELFDETLRRNGNRAVVTEYAWQTTSCDPCPSPPLEASDLYTLGEESFAAQANATVAQPGAPLTVPGKPTQGPVNRNGTMYFGSPPSWVLTRLHARYDRQNLTEDLLFRETDSVVGGTGSAESINASSGPQFLKSGPSTFQGRYIIRHYWEGKVQCKDPRYGIWGGPPGGGYNPGGSGPIEAAQDLASTPRGKVSLPAIIQSELPALGIKAKAHPLRPGEKR